MADSLVVISGLRRVFSKSHTHLQEAVLSQLPSTFDVIFNLETTTEVPLAWLRDRRLSMRRYWTIVSPPFNQTTCPISTLISTNCGSGYWAHPGSGCAFGHEHFVRHMNSLHRLYHAWQFISTLDQTHRLYILTRPDVVYNTYVPRRVLSDPRNIMHVMRPGKPWTFSEFHEHVADDVADFVTIGGRDIAMLWLRRFEVAQILCKSQLWPTTHLLSPEGLLYNWVNLHGLRKNHEIIYLNVSVCIQRSLENNCPSVVRTRR